MIDSYREWLFGCAERIRGDNHGKIDLAPILSELSISIQERSSSGNTSARLSRSEGKVYSILLTRGKSVGLEFSARERFTIAHELAHVLLGRKFGWFPLKSEGRPYYECEEMCQEFAARLLIDRKTLRNLRLETPFDLLRSIKVVSARFDVSEQAAARSVVESIGNCCIFRCQRKLNSKKSPVFSVLWCYSKISVIEMGRGKHLAETDELGRRLFDVSQDCQSDPPMIQFNEKFSMVPVRKANDQILVAISEPIAQQLV